MKKILVFFIIVASLSCNTNRQVATTGSQIGLLNLSHYYLKNSVNLNSNYNAMVIANEDDFENFFYAESPTGNPIVTPDFKGQVVVALALNRSGNDKMVFSKAEITKEDINIYGKQGTIQSEMDSPVALASLTKCNEAKKVNFFIDGVLVKTVSVSFKTGSSYANSTNNQSPATQKQIKRNLAVI